MAERVGFEPTVLSGSDPNRANARTPRTGGNSAVPRAACAHSPQPADSLTERVGFELSVLEDSSAKRDLSMRIGSYYEYSIDVL